MNLENFNKVLEQIEKHPETWDQSFWHSDCGTSHCVAGWCDVLTDTYDRDRFNSLRKTGCGCYPGEEERRRIRENAGEFLGVTVGQGAYLFDAYRTLQELKDFPNLVADDPSFDGD